MRIIEECLPVNSLDLTVRDSNNSKAGCSETVCRDLHSFWNILRRNIHIPVFSLFRHRSKWVGGIKKNMFAVTKYLSLA